MRRLNVKNTYKLSKDGETYIVTLSRVKKDVNNNPRFEAEIIAIADNYLSLSYVYRFTGHYMTEIEEAEWIVDRFIEEWSK